MADLWQWESDERYTQVIKILTIACQKQLQLTSHPGLPFLNSPVSKILKLDHLKKGSPMVCLISPKHNMVTLYSELSYHYKFANSTH